MVNLVVNLTGTGSFQELPTVPHEVQAILLQARTAAVMEYRFRGQVTYMTIKSGSSALLIGKFSQGDVFVQSAAGVIMEIEYATTGFTERG